MTTETNEVCWEDESLHSLKGHCVQEHSCTNLQSTLGAGPWLVVCPDALLILTATDDFLHLFFSLFHNAVYSIVTSI